MNRALAPRCVVFASDDVTRLCSERLGLPSLSALLGPWQTGGVERVQLHTISYETSTAPTFPLRFDEAASLAELTPEDRDGAWLDAFGAQLRARAEAWLRDEGELTAIDERATRTPWFDLFVETLYDKRPLTPTETFSHPVVCLMAVSTAHPEPLNALASLYAATSPIELYKDQPYMDPNVLRYYVVVHDVRNGDLAESQALLEHVKRAYGVHCTILPVNSYDPDAPAPLEGEKDTRPDYFDGLWDPYLAGADGDAVTYSVAPGTGLGQRDVLAIRVFLRELVVQSLVPWMERCVQMWNEQLAASRKGLTGRLFSAGRKYFGSRPASPAPGSLTAYNPARGFYLHQSQEAQTRKLADFAFMLRDYRLAASTYDLVRRDFSNDKAWPDYAAATRMYGLSQLALALFAPPQPRPDIDGLLEQALASLPQRSSAQFDELKMTCLFHELLRALGDVQTASRALARSAGEIEEVSSGLLLEQAALCDLSLQPRSHRRKFAFRSCMAAQRYEKAGLKVLARRCLVLATLVYTPTESDWRLIGTHVNYALGRLAYGLGRTDEAALHFLDLLVDDGDGQSDAAHLDDFKQAFSMLDSSAGDLLGGLREPIFHGRDARIVTSSSQAAALSRAREWRDLELELFGSEGPSGRSAIAENAGSLGETCTLRLTARNPLAAVLRLTKIRIEVQSEIECVEIAELDEVVLDPREERAIEVPIRTVAEARCTIVAIAYQLDGTLACRDPLARRGKRLNATQEQRAAVEPSYARDISFDLAIRAAVPALQATVHDWPTAPLLEGETVVASVRLTNAGSIAIAAVHALSGSPDVLSFWPGQACSQLDPYSRSAIDPATSSSASNSLLLPRAISLLPSSAPLSAGQSVHIPIVITATTTGSIDILTLFSFAAEGSQQFLPHRLSATLTVVPSLSILASISEPSAVGPAYSITLDVENASIDDMHITEVLAIAPSWSVTVVEGTVGDGALLELPPQQAGSVFLSADPVSSGPATAATEQFIASELDALLASQPVDGSSPPPLALSTSSIGGSASLAPDSIFTARLDAHLRVRRHAELARSFPVIARAQRSHIFPLHDPRSVTLVVLWSSASSSRRGHIVLPMTVQLGPARNIVRDVLARASARTGGLYEETQRVRDALVARIERSDYARADECPIVVGVEVEPVVHLSSAVIQPYELPVTLHLRNLSPLATARYDLLLERDGRTDGDDAAGIVPASFVGALARSGELEPDQTIVIEASCVLPCDGSFDVGRWQLSASAGGLSWRIEGSPRVVRAL